jgi:NAD(P)-dependent dehydrogenase (short-subunit alcohol dehydrogenase family)
VSYWQDKVVVVTGGSAGFGLAIAKAFGAAGSKVFIAALDNGQLAPATEEIRSAGGTADAIAADITQQADVDRVFSHVRDAHGRLDVLVNCAGKSTRGAVLDTTVEDFEDLLQLNFYGMVRCTRAAAPLLFESRGHIVNIGSLAAKSASRFVGAYPVSKHAVAAYSQQLRLELAPRGVHVLLVCPGPLARPDAGNRYNEQAKDLPDAVRKPGGGVKVKALSPHYMAHRILKACRRRQPDLVVPAMARLVFAFSQVFPSWGDWCISRMTG